MEVEIIMKLGKKLLAVALAGVLALSVLTGCSGSGSSSIDGKKIARFLSLGDSLGKNITIEYDNSLNQLASAAMDVVKKQVGVEIKINGKSNKVTLDNAIGENGILVHYGSNDYVIEREANGLKAALKLEGENRNKVVWVSLFNTKDIKGESYALANSIFNDTHGASLTEKDIYELESGKLGYSTSGDYTMFVIIGDAAQDDAEA